MTDKMKIAWLGIDYYDKGLLAKTWFRHNYQALLEWLQLKSEVICFANHYCGKFIKESDALKIEKKTEPDAIVIFDPDNWKNLDKVKAIKLMRCSDPWRGAYLKHLKFINKNRIDIVLVHFNIAVPFYEAGMKHGGIVRGFPHYIDERIFKPLNLERKYDVWCTGDMSSAHPIRLSAKKTLPSYPNIQSYINPGQELSVEEYVKLINSSKMGLFDDVHLELPNGILGKWTVGKWFENMSCETLCLADKPDDAELVHFEPEVNFIEVNTSNYIEKILYYKEHENGRKEIARRGYETFLKYHTCEKRVDFMLETIMEKIKI
jgi:hypothetical protein